MNSTNPQSPIPNPSTSSGQSPQSLIPTYFAEKMKIIYEEDGVGWLSQLPSLIKMMAQKWQLTVQRPVDNLSYNYVAHVTQANGTPAILKMGYPNRELFTEMDTLQIYEGNGMVRMLSADRENAAFLIDRISPGLELSDLKDDDEATRVVCRIIKALRRTAPTQHNFPSLADWAKVFGRYRAEFGSDGPLGLEDVNLAEHYFEQLNASSNDAVLLHGDLHHFNILQSENNEWVAIDPKGVIGDYAFETARFLHNPYPWALKNPDLKQMINRRVDIVCEMLGFDRQKVLIWGFCDTMFSVAWSVEDGDVEHLDWMLNFANVIRGMIGE
ncbi:MAG: aminoglycoside phosphotransferase family protein [Chloroflexota bacterium]